MRSASAFVGTSAQSVVALPSALVPIRRNVSDDRFMNFDMLAHRGWRRLHGGGSIIFVGTGKRDNNNFES